MENVEYTVLRINLVELGLPPEPVIDLPEMDEAMWHYSYSITFTPFSADRICITPRFRYFMYLKEDPEKKPVITIETTTAVSCTKSPSAEGKLFLLMRILNIGVWNLQGIYAAKTEHLELPGMLPVSPAFGNDSEHLKTDINAHWK